MTTHLCPLVGMRFHPPATAILQCLPAGAHLVLVPEPENAFDPNAVRVLVSSIEVPATQDEKLGIMLGGFGYSIEDFRAPEPDSEGNPTARRWDLGHLKANNNQDPSARWAAIIAPLLGGQEAPARLLFDMEGKPLVEVSL